MKKRMIFLMAASAILLSGCGGGAGDKGQLPVESSQSVLPEEQEDAC